MENTSLPNDIWSNLTASLSTDDDLTLYLAHIRHLAVKIIYIIIGTIGVLDNLFVISIFAIFIKIADKVLAVLIIVLNSVFVACFICI